MWSCLPIPDISRRPIMCVPEAGGRTSYVGLLVPRELVQVHTSNYVGHYLVAGVSRLAKYFSEYIDYRCTPDRCSNFIASFISTDTASAMPSWPLLKRVSITCEIVVSSMRWVIVRLLQVDGLAFTSKKTRRHPPLQLRAHLGAEESNLQKRRYTPDKTAGTTTKYVCI